MPDINIYSGLDFPAPPEDRPYAFINMVTTIDGKSVSGNNREPVADLGSGADHELMRRIENAADAILIGAGNLRSTPNLWYPQDKIRIVATVSGHLNYESRFFTDAPDKVIILCPDAVTVPSEFTRLTNVFSQALRELRQNFAIQRLLVEGGSNLNGQLLALNLIDELFLSLAPKVKLGEKVPTYAGGEPLSRENLQTYNIVEHHRVGDELFLRYRRQQS